MDSKDVKFLTINGYTNCIRLVAEFWDNLKLGHSTFRYFSIGYGDSRTFSDILRIWIKDKKIPVHHLNKARLSSRITMVFS